MARKDSLLEGLFDGIDQAIVNQPCKERDLHEISSLIPKWEELTPCFDLDEVEVEDIKETNSSPKLRRLAMLRKWKQKKGKKATYRALAETLVHQGLRNVAERLCDLIKGSGSQLGTDFDHLQGELGVLPCVVSYGTHLKGVYQSNLLSSFETDLLPSPTRKVFNLALISHRRVEYGHAIKNMIELLQKGKVNDILDSKKEVRDLQDHTGFWCSEIHSL